MLPVQRRREGRWPLHRIIQNRHDIVNATIEDAVG